MAMKLNTKLLDETRKLVNEKLAFVPMPGGAPPPGGDPSMGGGMPPPGGDPAAMGGGMPPPGGDPAAMGGAPMDPAAMGGAPMDPTAMGGGMPPPPAPPPPSPSGTITMSADELFKFVKQIVALCTNNKFGGDAKPTDGGPVSDNQAAANAKLDAILQAIQG